MIHQNHQGRGGFTLIELLVAVSIIGILIAIMVPALGKARLSAQTATCLSNQRQLMTSWTVAMTENRSRIPYITSAEGPNTPQREFWWGLLAEQYRGISVLVPVDPATPDSPVLCPTIETQFNRPFYNSLYFGYSVNSRWSDCADTGSQRRSWDDIRSPSEYPWFADPVLRVFPTEAIADSVIGKATAENFGLGFYHNGDSGNAVFADGHAKSNQVSVLDEVGPCGTPTWILAETSP